MMSSELTSNFLWISSLNMLNVLCDISVAIRHHFFICGQTIQFTTKKIYPIEVAHVAIQVREVSPIQFHQVSHNKIIILANSYTLSLYLLLYPNLEPNIRYLVTNFDYTHFFLQISKFNNCLLPQNQHNHQIHT